MRQISHLDVLHDEHTLLRFSSEVSLSLDPICQSVYKGKCPSSIEKQQKMSERCDLIVDMWHGR